MTTYNVTLRLSEKQFLSFLDATVAPLPMTIEVARETTEGAPTPATKLRGPRSSKVNDAILARLKEGPASAAPIKEALEKAGLSAGSFSTGIASLQKSGRIVRNGAGEYVAA